MANPVFNSYVQVGKVEEISDEISMIDPTNTPFLTMIGSEKCDNTAYSWQEDSLAAPADQAAVEGADSPAADQVPTLMRTNGTQIYTKTVSTTGTADAIKLYGRGKEFAYQLAKKGKEIKRDLEFSLVGTGQTQIVGSSTVARKMAGAQAQFSAAATVDIKVFTAQATNQPLSEAVIIEAMRVAYANGAEPNTIMIKPADSIKFAGFAASTGRMREIGDQKRLVNVVNVYETPFGAVKVVMNRWQRVSDAFFLDASMWKLRPLRAWFTKQLAETGDARKSALIGEFGLSHANFASDVLVTNLS